MPTMYIMHSS